MHGRWEFRPIKPARGVCTTQYEQIARIEIGDSEEAV